MKTCAPLSRKNGDSASANGHTLSTRQTEIVTYVARGLPDKQIASVLGISEETVAFHLRSAFRRLGVHSRSALVYQCATMSEALGLHERGGRQ